MYSVFYCKWKRSTRARLCLRHFIVRQQAGEEVNGTITVAKSESQKIPAKAKELSAPPLPRTEVEPLNPIPTSQEPNGEVPQSLVYPADPSITFISPPPPPHIPPLQVCTHGVHSLTLPGCAQLKVCKEMEFQLRQMVSPLY